MYCAISIVWFRAIRAARVIMLRSRRERPGRFHSSATGPCAYLSSAGATKLVPSTLTTSRLHRLRVPFLFCRRFLRPRCGDKDRNGNSQCYGSLGYAEMNQFAQTTAQAIANLAQGIGVGELAE